MTRSLMPLALVATLAIATSASAVLIAYEPFDYTAEEDLNGQSGGVGFTGAWRDGAAGGGTTKAGSLAGPAGLPTSGGHALLSGAGGTYTIFRDFAEIGLNDGDVTWISFLAQRTGEAQDPPLFGTNPYPRGVNVSFFDSNGTVDGTGNPDERFGIGNNSNATEDAWAIFFEGGSDRQASGTAWSTLSWGVMKIEHHGDSTVADDAYFWINPDPSVEPANGTADASLVGLYDLSNVDSLRPFIGNSSASGGNPRPAGEMLLDEVRIGTTYADMSAVPEPAALCLAGLAACGLVGRRRR